MKLFSSAQIKEWDRITIQNQNITSLQLMERAGNACALRILSLFPDTQYFVIICGKGNNGGDGLVIARFLEENGKECKVFAIPGEGAPDREASLVKYKNTGKPVFSSDDFFKTSLPANFILIDALLGTGLKDSVNGEAGKLIETVNKLNCYKIAIDVPSGVPSDFAGLYQNPGKFIRADLTLSIGHFKIPFFTKTYRKACGIIECVDIGLDSNYLAATEAEFEYIDAIRISSIYKPRANDSYKGENGHVLLIGGNRKTSGAILLAAKSALKSGAGLCSVCLPKELLTALNIYLPEAMYWDGNGEEYLKEFPIEIHKITATAIGPGLGTHAETREALFHFIENNEIPMVLDADAINMIAAEARFDLLSGKIITPHAGEFDRLFGKHEGDERIKTAILKAKELNCMIVLKGPNTFVASDTGFAAFNSTGNSALAKGGSGDVLTGCIAALLCQGYSSYEASMLGVYVHGRAADLAIKEMGVESLLAGELCDYIGKVFKEMNDIEK